MYVGQGEYQHVVITPYIVYTIIKNISYSCAQTSQVTYQINKGKIMRKRNASKPGYLTARQDRMTSGHHHHRVTSFAGDGCCWVPRLKLCSIQAISQVSYLFLETL